MSDTIRPKHYSIRYGEKAFLEGCANVTEWTYEDAKAACPYGAHSNERDAYCDWMAGWFFSRLQSGAL
jgi:hypothetical protein